MDLRSPMHDSPKPHIYMKYGYFRFIPKQCSLKVYGATTKAVAYRNHFKRWPRNPAHNSPKPHLHMKAGRWRMVPKQCGLKNRTAIAFHEKFGRWPRYTYWPPRPVTPAMPEQGFAQLG